MKGHYIIPILSMLLVVPLSAQTAQVQSLDKAKVTIASADATYHQGESEVLSATAQQAPVKTPALPNEPVFKVPSDQVVLDLPGANPSATAVSVDTETISVDFPEEDVRDIIRSVAELYELNVVIPDSLAGSISIKLRNVTWQQVFSVVLEPMNYTYIVDGNIIKIKNRDELAVEPVATRVFIVDFAKASEIRNSVDPLIDKAAGGKIQVDTRSNALVITERPSRMNDIQEIIETLDRPTEQVMIESKFIEISNREGEKKGIDWQSLAGYGVQAGPFLRTYEAEGSRNRDADKTNPNLNEFDSTTSNQINNEPATTINSSGTLSDDWWINTVGRMDTAVFSAEAFKVVISALDTFNDIELVSNPTVVTMNNSPARINIGEEYPIPSYTYNDERGTFEVSDFEWKNIGINLEVTPQINSAGFINLNIQPEISSRSGEVEFGGASGAIIPIITTRKTASTVTIKSGYTLAIGGLIEKTGNNRTTSVPVLGEIPLIGKLFSSKSRDEATRNLVIFITAKILSASGATYEDVFSPRILQQMGIQPRDVPGFQPTEAENQLYQEVLKSREDVERLKEEYKAREELQLLDSALQQGNTDLEIQATPPEEQAVPRRNFKG